MKKPHAPRVRELLRENNDGLTLCQISDSTGISKDTLKEVLRKMPDAYIDRWSGPFRGQWAAVWCAVAVPEHCPHPESKE